MLMNQPYPDVLLPSPENKNLKAYVVSTALGYFWIGKAGEDSGAIDMADPSKAKQTLPLTVDIAVEVYGDWLVTADSWEQFNWNPYVGYNATDKGYQRYQKYRPNFPRKPTWDELLRVVERWWLHHTYDPSKAWSSDVVTDMRDQLIGAPVKHRLTKAGIDPGAGLGHLPAMTYLAHENTLAGQTVEPSVLRKSDRGTLTLWTAKHKADFLASLGNRTNRVESARNVIWSEISPLLDIATDPNGGLAENSAEEAKHQARIAAAKKLETALRWATLSKRFAAAMENREQIPLPNDLRTRRTLFIEGLEAVATGHQKSLKSGLTQQAIDNWASCVDQDNALRTIARLLTIYSIDIQRANTTTKAKGAYEAGVKAIRAVAIANVPVWRNGSAPLASGATVTGRKLVLEAHHPTGKTIPGNVVISNWGADPGGQITGTFSAIPLSTGYRLTLELDAAASGPIQVTARAYNLCGPSELAITLQPA